MQTKGFRDRNISPFTSNSMIRETATANYIQIKSLKNERHSWPCRNHRWWAIHLFDFSFNGNRNWLHFLMKIGLQLNVKFSLSFRDLLSVQKIQIISLHIPKVISLAFLIRQQIDDETKIVIAFANKNLLDIFSLYLSLSPFYRID